MRLYHGSSEIITRPFWDGGKTNNDYGQGFYCTEHLELAREWACNEGRNGFVNSYEVNVEELKVLNLLDEKYSILHWLALLMEYRGARISTPAMKKGVEWLKQNYLPDISDYDVIVGYRADDSYFSFARAFVNNQISLRQLSRAMKLGDLGQQYVIKSQKAFDNLHFIDSETVDNVIYYPKRKNRDYKARMNYMRELEREEADDLYIRDLMRKGAERKDESV